MQTSAFARVEMNATGRAAGQRPTGPDQGRQPTRARRRAGQGGDARVDDRRHPADEAVQLQRGAHVTLPERLRCGMSSATSTACTWSTRPTSSATRHLASLCHDAALGTRVPRPGRTRMVERDKNHPFDHPLVARQRERLRANAFDALAGWVRGYDPSRPCTTRALEFRNWYRKHADHRRDLSDVSGPIDGDRRLGERSEGAVRSGR